MVAPLPPESFAEGDFADLVRVEAELEAAVIHQLEDPRVAALKLGALIEAEQAVLVEDRDSLKGDLAASEWWVAAFEHAKNRLDAITDYLGDSEPSKHELAEAERWAEGVEARLSDRFRAIVRKAAAKDLIVAMDPVVVTGCTYLGGAPDIQGPMRSLVVALHLGVSIMDERGVESLASWFGLEEILGLSVEGPEEADKRVTASRVAAVGIFAWAFKKKEKRAYLTVHLASTDLLFEVSGISRYELAGQLQTYVSALERWRQPITPLKSSQDAAQTEAQVTTL